MKKKLVFGMLIGLFSLFVLVGSSFAEDTFYVEMADGINGNVKNTFGWNETPWLHLHLDPGDWNISGTVWESPSQKYYLTTSGGTSQDFWVSLDFGEDVNGDDITWNSVWESGLWNLKGIYLGVPQGYHEYYTTSFTVAPEPVSSALFLIGGLSLAGVAYKRRKKSSV